MAEFVSGLPDREKPGADPRGMEMLRRIRLLAKREAAELESLTRRRFDGVERTEPDPDAIAAKADYETIVQLVDLITEDIDRLPRVTRALAGALRSRAGGR